MSRRVSQRRRINFSELVNTSEVKEQDVLCDQKIRHGTEPRKLVYRRLRGMENVFDGTWPEKTNIHCWYCRLPFDSTPVPIVQQYDPVKDLYDVYGITCSPACSKAFISRNNNNDSRTRLMWQSKMLIEVFGWPREKPIPTADDWEAIDVFGGYMPIDQWRKNKPGVKIRVKKPPFVPFHIFIETEYKGLSVIDQTTDDCALADQADTLEQQAVMHGAAFSLKGLKRPEEDKIIRTTAQLHVAHPRHKEEEANSVFDEFLRTQPLPTDGECKNIRDQREALRKANRKRKKTAISVKTTAAAARGKTLFVQDTEDAAADTPPMERSTAKRKGSKRVTITTQPPTVFVDLPATKHGLEQLDTPAMQLNAPAKQLNAPAMQLDTPAMQLDEPAKKRRKLDHPANKRQQLKEPTKKRRLEQLDEPAKKRHKTAEVVDLKQRFEEDIVQEAIVQEAIVQEAIVQEAIVQEAKHRKKISKTTLATVDEKAVNKHRKKIFKKTAVTVDEEAVNNHQKAAAAITKKKTADKELTQETNHHKARTTTVTKKKKTAAVLQEIETEQPPPAKLRPSITYKSGPKQTTRRRQPATRKSLTLRDLLMQRHSSEAK